MSLLPRRLLDAVRPQPWPESVERPARRRNIGIDYDSSWTRTPLARLVRSGALEGIGFPLAHLVASPTILGDEVFGHLDGPVIFAPNHTSHLDTTLVLSALPTKVRRKTVVAAAADYFFDRPWKATASALLLGAIPVERKRINRQSADIAVGLIERGWNLVIFPEGGRSPDGWGQEFSPASAAYLAKRCDVAVIPVHLDGVRAIFPKGASRLTPGNVTIRFGKPMLAMPATAEQKEEDARRFSLRIEQAVSILADEAESDWWSARRRAAAGETPSFRGPETSSWRRAWALPERRRQPNIRLTRWRKVEPW